MDEGSNKKLKGSMISIQEDLDDISDKSGSALSNRLRKFSLDLSKNIDKSETRSVQIKNQNYRQVDIIEEVEDEENQIITESIEKRRRASMGIQKVQ